MIALVGMLLPYAMRQGVLDGQIDAEAARDVLGDEVFALKAKLQPQKPNRARRGWAVCA